MIKPEADGYYSIRHEKNGTYLSVESPRLAGVPFYPDFGLVDTKPSYGDWEGWLLEPTHCAGARGGQPTALPLDGGSYCKTQECYADRNLSGDDWCVAEAEVVPAPFVTMALPSVNLLHGWRTGKGHGIVNKFLDQVDRCSFAHDTGYWNYHRGLGGPTEQHCNNHLALLRCVAQIVPRTLEEERARNLVLGSPILFVAPACLASTLLLEGVLPDYYDLPSDAQLLALPITEFPPNSCIPGDDCPAGKRRLCNVPGDLDSDCDVDDADIALLQSAYGHLGCLGDPLDLDNDKDIDAANAALLAQRCTGGPCDPNASPDTTAPTTVATVSPGPNLAGWNDGNVVVALAASDDAGGRGVKKIVYSASGGQTIAQTEAFASSHSIELTAEGTTMLTFFAVDNRDNAEAPQSTTVRIDRTPPLLAHSRSLSANAQGWNNTDVLVTFQCADATSGVADPPEDLLVDREGANLTGGASCSDVAGNITSLELTDVNIDRTPPTITRAGRTPANAAGWNNTDVSVDWSCADALSGAVETGVGASFGSEGAGQSATGTCADRADNTASDTVTGINIDRTPPAIAGSRAPLANAFGWNNSPVTVSFTCDDALSGIDGCTGPQVVADEGEAQARRGTAVDRAGNEAGTSVAAISVDLTAPAIIGTLAPAPNANGWNRTDVLVSFACADALSGVATCSAPTLLTQEGGAHVVNGAAADRAGNTATAALLARIDKTAPELAVQFDAASLDLTIAGRDGRSGVPTGAQPPLSVVPVPWDEDDDDADDDDGDDDEDEMNAELRTYRIVDAADNTVLVVLKVKRGGHNLQARLVELRYNDGATAPLVRNRLRFEWTADETGALRRLMQDVEIGRGPDRQDIRADFDGRRNETTISARDDDKKKSRRPGLMMVRIATSQGRLGLEY